MSNIQFRFSVRSLVSFQRFSIVNMEQTGMMTKTMIKVHAFDNSADCGKRNGSIDGTSH
jgi:hypothetical protein